MSLINPVITAYGSGVSEVAGRLPRGRGGTGRAQAVASPTERVEISSASHDMRTVRAALSDLPEVRLPIVQEIRDRIERNDYPFETAIGKALNKMIDEGVLA